MIVVVRETWLVAGLCAQQRNACVSENPSDLATLSSNA